MMLRALQLLLAALAGLALSAAPAVASLAGEVSAGKAVATRVDAGRASCATLTDTQFEQLGEYLMDRMVGSRAAHAVMNARMERALADDDTERMHELMGRRYAGCGSGDASTVPFGPGMMATGAGMMGSPAWGWMRQGAWQRMRADDWRELAGSMMGDRYATGHGWSTGGVLALVLAALLLGGVLALLIRRPRRGPPPAAPRAA